MDENPAISFESRDDVTARHHRIIHTIHTRVKWLLTYSLDFFLERNAMQRSSPSTTGQAISPPYTPRTRPTRRSAISAAPAAMPPVTSSAQSNVSKPSCWHGYAYEGKTSWNESHMNYLRELTMPCSSQKSILEEYLSTITDGVDRVTRIEQNMGRELENWHLKPVVQALMAFKGFKIIAAMITVSELGDVCQRHPSPATHVLSRTCFQRAQQWPEALHRRHHQMRQRPPALDSRRVFPALREGTQSLAPAQRATERAESIRKTPKLESPEPAAQSIRKIAQTPPAPQQNHRRRRARTQF
jgi:hypothetical protein